MFWKKKKECEDGTVCAWKFNGVLYESKYDRDKAAEKHHFEFLKSVCHAKLCDRRVSYKYLDSVGNTSYYTLVEEKPYLPNEKLSPNEFIEFLIKNKRLVLTLYEQMNKIKQEDSANNS